MKRIVLIIVALLVFSVRFLNAGIGTRVFNSSNYSDVSITADEVDPFIVIDADNSRYGLCYTRFSGPYIFCPYIQYADNSSGIWNMVDINPYGTNYEYIQSRMHILDGGNRVLSFRFASDFSPTDVYTKGTWATMLDPNSGTWQNDHSENSFTHISYRDYTSSSNEVHFLSIWNYPNKTLKYFKRNSNGTYTGQDVAESNDLWQGLPQFDLTIGESNTPYFCYRVDNDLKVRRNEESEIAIITGLNYNIASWNSKLAKMSPPTIAYNSQSGKVMVVFSDYDSGTGLWSLYYSLKNSGSSSWSTPVKVYSNTIEATYPHIVADKNSGDFFVSFLSFDSGSQYNHVYLQVTRYVDSENIFGPPFQVADIGQLNYDGNSVYKGRPVHSVVLPYLSVTKLVVASIYFEGDLDSDVRLYEVNFPTTYECTFRNIVVDQDAGEQLKLTNINASTSETFNSGSMRPLNIDNDYKIETLPRKFDDYDYHGSVGDYKHHDWNDVYTDYKIVKNINTSVMSHLY